MRGREREFREGGSMEEDFREGRRNGGRERELKGGGGRLKRKGISEEG